MRSDGSTPVPTPSPGPSARETSNTGWAATAAARALSSETGAREAVTMAPGATTRRAGFAASARASFGTSGRPVPTGCGRSSVASFSARAEPGQSPSPETAVTPFGVRPDTSSAPAPQGVAMMKAEATRSGAKA